MPLKRKSPILSSSFLWTVCCFLFLNTLLLLPSFFVGMQSSTFFPIPDPGQPTTSVSWSRGWYDMLLYVLVRRPNQDLFRICVEMVFLTSILLLFASHRNTKRVRHLAITIFLFLLTYEVYNAIVYSFFHRNGLLYEDFQYAINLYYLASDLFSFRWLIRVLFCIAGLAGILWLIPRSFKSLQSNASDPSMKRGFIILSLLFWPITFAVWSWYGSGAENTTLRTLTPKMVSNVRNSIAMKAMIQELDTIPVDSVYSTFMDIPIQRHPNINLIMIESYGDILNEDPALKTAYDTLVSGFEKRLLEKKWFMSSAVSRAPVRGGLSWMSMNSVLGGIRLDSNTLYHRYRSRLQDYPHLPAVLEANGYATFTLQPPTRARAGLAVENLYNFTKAIYFDDLNYQGPAYSLFIIPDQYSLNYAYEKYIRPLKQPYFLFFETVITHAPWEAIPPYLSDWKQFNTLTQTQLEDTPLSANVISSFQRRLNSGFQDLNEKYITSLAYDFRVIESFMSETAPENSLFIILGDHQPPLLKSNSYLTPIHILSKDSLLVADFNAHGFVPGTQANTEQSTPFTHEGLYSLLFSVLAKDGQKHLYRPKGIPPSILAN